jgi:hypothetical protein
MHDMEVATHYIHDRERIVVTIDEYDHECPVAWIDGGVVVLDSAYSGQLEDIDPLDDDGNIIRSIYERGGNAAVEKHYARQGYRAKIASLHGYVQSRWADVVVYVPESEGFAGLDSTVDSVKRWFAGDIYALSHELLKHYYEEANTSREDYDLAIWDCIDSIGAVYLPDCATREQVLEVAADYFHLSTFA